MLEGVARKVAFLLVFGSAVAWITFNVGFGIRYVTLEYQSNATVSNTTVVRPEYFSHWCFATSAFPLYLVTFIHLLCGNICTATMTLLLVPVYLVTAGGVLNSDGLDIYHSNNTDYETVEFAGALASVTFFWMALVLWAWLSDRNKRKDYTPIN